MQIVVRLIKQNEKTINAFIKPNVSSARNVDGQVFALFLIHSIRKRKKNVFIWVTIRLLHSRSTNQCTTAPLAKDAFTKQCFQFHNSQL